MRKNSFFFFICIIVQLFFANHTSAQTKLKKVEFNISGFIDPYKLTNHPLIPPSSRGRTNFGDEINYDLLSSVALKNPHFNLVLGVGSGTRHFSMNKYRIESLIILIFLPFLNSQDSFHLSSIKYAANYLNFTTGFAYALTKKERRIKFFTGLQLLHSFKTKSNVILETDKQYFTPPAQTLAQLQKQYEDQLRNYTLRLNPFIEMQIRIAKGAGIKLGYSGFNFYPTAWTKSLTKQHIAIGGNVSIFYQLPPK